MAEEHPCTAGGFDGVLGAGDELDVEELGADELDPDELVGELTGALGDTESDGELDDELEGADVGEGIEDEGVVVAIGGSGC